MREPGPPEAEGDDAGRLLPNLDAHLPQRAKKLDATRGLTGSVDPSPRGQGHRRARLRSSRKRLRKIPQGWNTSGQKMRQTITILSLGLCLAMVTPILLFGPISALSEIWYIIVAINIISIVTVLYLSSKQYYNIAAILIFLVLFANILNLNKGSFDSYSNVFGLYYHIAAVFGVPVYFLLLSKYVFKRG